MAITWDGSNTNADITLSGGNLTATCSAGGSAWQFTQATAGYSTGKYYWEIVDTTGASGFGAGLGNAQSSPWGGSTFSNAFIWARSGAYYLNGSSPASIASYTSGNTIRLAVDLGAKLIWGAVSSGNWNNSGTANPATGVGGISYSGDFSGAIYAMLYMTVSGNVGRAAFLASSFSFSAPSGFSAYDPGTSVTANGFVALELGGSRLPVAIPRWTSLGRPAWRRIAFLYPPVFSWTLTNDLALPAEATSKAARDATVPSESLASGSVVTGDTLLPIEFLSVLPRSGFQLEWLMQARGSDSAARGEWVLRAQRDAGVPSENTGTIPTIIDALLPLEMLATHRRGNPAMAEALSTARIDGGAAAEALSGQRADIPAGLEWLLRAFADAILRAENTGAVAQVADAVLPIEALLRAQRDSGAAAELGSGAIRDASIPAESTGGLRAVADGVVPIEALSRALSDIGLQLEDLGQATTVADQGMALEVLSVRQIDQAGSLEWVVRARSADTVLVTESGLAARGDATVAGENTALFAADTAPQSETTGRLGADSLLQDESLMSITVLLDEQLPIELGVDTPAPAPMPRVVSGIRIRLLRG